MVKALIGLLMKYWKNFIRIDNYYIVKLIIADSFKTNQGFGCNCIMLAVCELVETTYLADRQFGKCFLF